MFKSFLPQLFRNQAADNSASPLEREVQDLSARLDTILNGKYAQQAHSRLLDAVDLTRTLCSKDINTEDLPEGMSAETGSSFNEKDIILSADLWAKIIKKAMQDRKECLHQARLEQENADFLHPYGQESLNIKDACLREAQKIYMEALVIFSQTHSIDTHILAQPNHKDRTLSNLEAWIDRPEILKIHQFAADFRSNDANMESVRAVCLAKDAEFPLIAGDISAKDLPQILELDENGGLKFTAKYWESLLARVMDDDLEQQIFEDDIDEYGPVGEPFTTSGYTMAAAYCLVQLGAIRKKDMLKITREHLDNYKYEDFVFEKPQATSAAAIPTNEPF